MKRSVNKENCMSLTKKPNSSQMKCENRVSGWGCICGENLDYFRTKEVEFISSCFLASCWITSKDGSVYRLTCLPAFGAGFLYQEKTLYVLLTGQKDQNPFEIFLEFSIRNAMAICYPEKIHILLFAKLGLKDCY